MNSLIDQQIIERARRKVGFKIHFTVFLLLTPVNWIIWFLTDTTYLWPVWPTLGWGIGIMFHWLGVFHGDKFFSVSNEIERMKHRE
ncbi:MAG: 2TM domain-containing protein [Bacteroidia bacterium]|jgi:hypothetical protein|nr:2TM domain-containing protein [Bacteroidia bacterium]